MEDANKKLALELEHEKGKLAGLAQSHNTLREHSNILESALAKREADLVQLNLQVKIGVCFFLNVHDFFMNKKLFFSNFFCFPLFPLVFQVQAVLKRKEEEDQQMKQVVQSLQLALEKEKSKVKDLKEQVGAHGQQQGLSILCADVV